MPIISKSTGIDDSGRLRSYTHYNCSICDKECKSRNDVYKWRNGLCKECLIKKSSKKYQEKTNFEIVCTNIIFDRLNKRYSKRGLICTIKGQSLLKLLKSNCHYCNSSPSNIMEYKQKFFKYDFIYNGLDRIDSSKGYIIENVVPCCKKCNIAKMDLSYDDFINHIKKIYLNICQ